MPNFIASRKGKLKETPLLKRLREEKDGQVRGGIYHRTQIDQTYNSNHIEGSRLTHEQTRFIFEANTIGITDESVNVDDIVETTNHFLSIDLITDWADEKLSESLIKELHRILKSGTTPYMRYPGKTLIEQCLWGAVASLQVLRFCVRAVPGPEFSS